MKPFLLLMLLPLTACVSADDGAMETAAAPAGLSPEQIVTARQSAFHLSAIAFGSMKPAVDSGADPKPLTFAARGLAKWARALPSMFPEGTALPSSKARPELWADRGDFEAKAAAYLAAATALADAAQAGDKPAFAARWTEVRETCSACHDPYRVEPAR